MTGAAQFRDDDPLDGPTGPTLDDVLAATFRNSAGGLAQLGTVDGAAGVRDDGESFADNSWKYATGTLPDDALEETFQRLPRRFASPSASAPSRPQPNHQDYDADAEDRRRRPRRQRTRGASHYMHAPSQDDNDNDSDRWLGLTAEERRVLSQIKPGEGGARNDFWE